MTIHAPVTEHLLSILPVAGAAPSTDDSKRERETVPPLKEVTV